LADSAHLLQKDMAGIALQFRAGESKRHP
jgi:hypothetical protein